ncbi:MAG TPA: hypothetical protein VFC99_04750 [Acidimicrobiia bacterium]|nr:hypothetical protein [Acidimicrobiia bacterium]
MEDSPGGGVDLAEVEAELCRLPDVAAVRIVADAVGRPVEVHVLAHTGKQPKQVVRDVQSVALASFGIELDRRIVSVVQLGPNGAAQPTGGAENGTRARITATQSQSSGLRTTVQVSLAHRGDEAVGFAEGSVAGSARPRLVALAALDALRQLEPGADNLDVDSAQVVRAGTHDVVVVSLVYFDPPIEHHLTGSAMVHSNVDDATVRAVLDATNRRLSHLAARRDGA